MPRFGHSRADPQVQGHKHVKGVFSFLTKCEGYPADWAITTESLLETAREALSEYLAGPNVGLTLEVVEATLGGKGAKAASTPKKAATPKAATPKKD